MCMYIYIFMYIQILYAILNHDCYEIGKMTNSEEDRELGSHIDFQQMAPWVSGSFSDVSDMYSSLELLFEIHLM